MNHNIVIIDETIQSEHFEFHSPIRIKISEKDALLKTIADGTYAFVDSFSSRLGLSAKEEKERFIQLGKLLSNRGMSFKQVEGSYKGEISHSSYFIPKPQSISEKIFRRLIFKLGKIFDQESVVLSTAGNVELVFTTGKNSGRSFRGRGYKLDSNENYSIIKCDCELGNRCKNSIKIGEYNLDQSNLTGVLDDFKDLIFLSK